MLMSSTPLLLATCAERQVSCFNTLPVSLSISLNYSTWAARHSTGIHTVTVTVLQMQNCQATNNQVTWTKCSKNYADGVDLQIIAAMLCQLTSHARASIISTFSGFTTITTSFIVNIYSICCMKSTESGDQNANRVKSTPTISNVSPARYRRHIWYFCSCFIFFLSTNCFCISNGSSCLPVRVYLLGCCNLWLYTSLISSQNVLRKSLKRKLKCNPMNVTKMRD